MLSFFKRRESILDKPIDRVLADMDEYGPDDPKFPQLIDHLERLTKMKAEERRNRVSPDTMATIFGNVGMVLIIVLYEQKHVLTSKGLGLIRMRDPH